MAEASPTIAVRASNFIDFMTSLSELEILSGAPQCTRLGKEVAQFAATGKSSLAPTHDVSAHLPHTSNLVAFKTDIRKWKVASIGRFFAY